MELLKVMEIIEELRNEYKETPIIVSTLNHIMDEYINRDKEYAKDSLIRLIKSLRSPEEESVNSVAVNK